MAERFAPDTGGTEVVTYIVHGLGHVWPGGPVTLAKEHRGKKHRQAQRNGCDMGFLPHAAQAGVDCCQFETRELKQL